jgi:hypothetical protein
MDPVQDDPPVDEPRTWCVLVEVEDGSQYGPEFLFGEPPEQFADRAGACRDAERRALDYLSREDRRGKGPWVYRVNEGEWVVMNRGARVSIRVAELITTHPDGHLDGTEPAELIAAEAELRRQDRS